jgi:hypothetical protein
MRSRLVENLIRYSAATVPIAALFGSMFPGVLLGPLRMTALSTGCAALYVSLSAVVLIGKSSLSRLRRIWPALMLTTAAVLTFAGFAPLAVALWVLVALFSAQAWRQMPDYPVDAAMRRSQATASIREAIFWVDLQSLIKATHLTAIRPRRTSKSTRSKSLWWWRTRTAWASRSPQPQLRFLLTIGIIASASLLMEPSGARWLAIGFACWLATFEMLSIPVDLHGTQFRLSEITAAKTVLLPIGIVALLGGVVLAAGNTSLPLATIAIALAASASVFLLVSQPADPTQALLDNSGQVAGFLLLSRLIGAIAVVFAAALAATVIEGNAGAVLERVPTWSAWLTLAGLLAIASTTSFWKVHRP